MCPPVHHIEEHPENYRDTSHRMNTKQVSMKNLYFVQSDLHSAAAPGASAFYWDKTFAAAQEERAGILAPKPVRA